MNVFVDTTRMEADPNPFLVLGVVMLVGSNYVPG